MQDHQKIRDYRQACCSAQKRFNDLAEAHKKATEGIAFAEQARDMAARLIAVEVGLAAEAARALREHGCTVPILIEDHDFYRDFVAGMDAGELHADLEAIARTQRFGDAENRQAA